MSVPATERDKAPTEDYLLASEMSEAFKLLPCPFCGSDKIYYKKYQTVVGERWGVICGECIAEVDCGYAAQHSQARDRWNRRAPAPEATQ